MKRIVLLIAFAIGVTAIAFGQSISHSSDHGFFQTQDMKWMDGPASLPKGSKVALQAPQVVGSLWIRRLSRNGEMESEGEA